MSPKSQSELLPILNEIGNLSSNILADPEKHINLLKDLIKFNSHKESQIVKFSLLSQLAIFRDIIPGYRIRQLSDQELQTQVSKEVKAQRTYEQTLVGCYYAYLQSLDSVASQNHPILHSQTADESLLLVAISCMAELLKSVSHFNFRQFIISSLVKRMKLKSVPGLIDTCSSTIEYLFQHDISNEASLDAVRAVSKLVKSCKFDIHPRVLEVFLHLKLVDDPTTFLESPDQELSHESGKKRKRVPQVHLSKKARKSLKRQKEVEAELKEAEAVYDKKEVQARQTEILKLMFEIYFRILKQSPNSPLLSKVLEGLARFGRLINIDFFSDLMKILKSISLNQFQRYMDGLAKSSSDTAETSLHCIIAAFELLHSLGDSLAVDLKDFFSSMYAQMARVAIQSLYAKSVKNGNASGSAASNIHRDSIELMLTGFQLMFTKSRQVPTSRIAAFVKRLASLCFTLPAHAALAALSMISMLFTKHSKLHGFLESDSSLALGVYNPYLGDPDLCNALSSTLWEISTLHKYHYHPAVRDMSRFILVSFSPGASSSTIPTVLKSPAYDPTLFSFADAQKDPVSLYKKYDPMRRRGFSMVPQMSLPHAVASFNPEKMTTGMMLKGCRERGKEDIDVERELLELF